MNEVTSLRRRILAVATLREHSINCIATHGPRGCQTAYGNKGPILIIGTLEGVDERLLDEPQNDRLGRRSATPGLHYFASEEGGVFEATGGTFGSA